MEISDKLFKDIKSYISTRPIKEAIGIYSEMVLEEARQRQASVPIENPAPAPREGGE